MIASLDGIISSWDIRPERMIEHACKFAGRNLTEDEWRDVLGTRPLPRDLSRQQPALTMER